MPSCGQIAIETLRDGSQVLVRPIQPTDVELERRFIEELSPESRRYRFLCGLRSPSDALLRQLTQIDEQRDAALIALTDHGDDIREVGAARFSVRPDGKADLAVTVSDDWRLRGLGTALVRRLIEVARQRGIAELVSVDPADNHPMHKFADSLGFGRTRDPEDATQVIHSLSLQARAPA
jgi:GNAT superfamily N-acetyltransferase